jgi:hypothetical protein
MSKQVIGVSQELGRSCLLHGRRANWGVPSDSEKAPAGGSGISSHLERTDDAAGVPPNEGNEVRRDGRQEVVAS